MMAALWPLPRLGIRLIRVAGRRDPTRLVSAAGTVGGDSAGDGWPRRRVGPGAGRAIAAAGRRRHHPASPLSSTSASEPRDILNLTVAFDHNIVDGARRRGSCTG
jgi:hypothetical protein